MTRETRPVESHLFSAIYRSYKLRCYDYMSVYLDLLAGTDAWKKRSKDVRPQMVVKHGNGNHYP